MVGGFGFIVFVTLKLRLAWVGFERERDKDREKRMEKRKTGRELETAFLFGWVILASLV